MRLLAIADLHLGHRANREALRTVPPHRSDWLIIAGDIGETAEHLRFCFDELVPRFARVVWVPGNHELWTAPGGDALRGAAKYDALVALARSYGVATPEDPYPIFNGRDGPLAVVPLFLLYDYSFRPTDVAAEAVIAWAAEENSVCSDEFLLRPDPYPSRSAWCAARCREAERRLSALPAGLPTVLVNHFPLEERLAVLPRIPRFTPWCGTRLTRGWHRRFNARAAVYGHLHIRGRRRLDGTSFEEVSLGYPRQWDAARGIEGYLRDIATGPSEAAMEALRGTPG